MTEQPEVSSPLDATAGTPLGGIGATVEPPNQGHVGPFTYGEQKQFLIGQPGYGYVDQPDANYHPDITTSWPTEICKYELYTDHFVVTFTNPGPADGWFDWKIDRTSAR